MTKEILALKLADDEVNKGKKGYDRDVIFLAKAVTLLCMARKNRDACYVACNFMLPDIEISEQEWQSFKHIDMEEFQKIRLDEEKIPEFTFDVHTLKGKYKLGKTDLDMTIDEENALEPHQYSLFDYGDWSEWYMKEDKEGHIKSENERKKIDEFMESQRQLQKEHGTEDNFKRV